eukprot:9502577-Pyramimonas_sp.AAC.1
MAAERHPKWAHMRIEHGIDATNTRASARFPDDLVEHFGVSTIPDDGHLSEPSGPVLPHASGPRGDADIAEHIQCRCSLAATILHAGLKWPSELFPPPFRARAGSVRRLVVSAVSTVSADPEFFRRTVSLLELPPCKLYTTASFKFE